MLSPISVCFILGILSDTLHSKRKELENKHYFDGLNIDIGSFCDRIYGYILKCFKTSDLKRIFVSGDGAKWINNFASILRNCFRAEDIDVIQVLDKKPASSGIQNLMQYGNTVNNHENKSSRTNSGRYP